MEEWKKHPRLNILVSSEGRIKVPQRKVDYGKRGVWTFKERLVPQHRVTTNRTNNYYMKCSLWAVGEVDKKSNAYWVHRLVAETFCDKKDGCEYVDHLNGNGEDNRAENLEWVTNGENVRRRLLLRGIVSDSEQSRRLGGNIGLVKRRIENGWCRDCARTIPNNGWKTKRVGTTCPHTKQR